MDTGGDRNTLPVIFREMDSLDMGVGLGDLFDLFP